VIIFDKFSVKQPERKSENLTRIIAPLSLFTPEMEESPVFTKRIDGLVWRKERTKERTKKETQDGSSYPLISDHSRDGFCKQPLERFPTETRIASRDLAARQETP